jgi:hypothetical protein
MEMFEPLNPVKEKDLAEFEKKLDIKIPPSYRKFLLKYYGGQPLKNNFYKQLPSGGVLDFQINCFLGISDNFSLDLRHTYVIMLGQIPAELLPISDDGIGNKICIGMSDKYFGKIYIWWAEQAVDENAKPDYSNVEELAHSFDEFMEMLR